MVLSIFSCSLHRMAKRPISVSHRTPSTLRLSFDHIALLVFLINLIIILFRLVHTHGTTSSSRYIILYVFIYALRKGV